MRWPNLHWLLRRAQADLSNGPNGNTRQANGNGKQKKGRRIVLFSNATCCQARAPLPETVQKLGRAARVRHTWQLCGREGAAGCIIPPPKRFSGGKCLFVEILQRAKDERNISPGGHGAP